MDLNYHNLNICKHKYLVRHSIWVFRKTQVIGGKTKVFGKTQVFSKPQVFSKTQVFGNTSIW